MAGCMPVVVQNWNNVEVGAFSRWWVILLRIVWLNVTFFANNCDHYIGQRLGLL